MATLIYSPGVRVVIQTAGHGIINVSEDLQSGRLTIREEAPSSFSFVLLNHRRKYDGVFTPNDTISVQMKRFRWMPVFAGYLDSVPFYSVYPRNVEITATDTLKRLKYRLWDPGTQASVNLLNFAAPDGVNQQDGGLRDVVQTVLHKVGKWPEDKIHIGRLPEDWAKKMAPLRKKVWKQIDSDPTIRSGDGESGSWSSTSPGSTGGGLPDDDEYLPRPMISPGIDGVSAGKSPGSMGQTISRERIEIVGNPAATGVLPTNSPVAISYGGTGSASLTGESLATPDDPWYVRMRWPYSLDGITPAPGLSDAGFKQAKAWWTNRLLLVTNPKTFRSVVLRAADWADDDKIGLSSHALTTVLGGKDGDALDVRFAPESFVPGSTYTPGVEKTSARSVTDGGGLPNDNSTGVGTGELPWEDTADGGGTLQSNTNAARAFIRANWRPTSIGGYSYRLISGTNTLSDHATGTALDVFPGGAGENNSGPALTKGNSIALWFAANPQVFSTKYIIYKDRINSGSGWTTYRDPGSSDNTQQHRDHVHISFNDTGQTSAGPMGGPWPGGTEAAFNGNVMGGYGADPTAGGTTGVDGEEDLFNFNWNPHPSTASQMLTGYRALMNDVPLLDSVDKMVKASMRSYMAAPNGDFISWFPDYFGAYGTAGRMNVKDIELAGDAFSIIWDDSRMVTHQFAYGSMTGLSDAPDDPGAAAMSLYSQIFTKGIASVEFPELMEALFNIKKGDPRAKNYLNPDAILKRFGARVSRSGMGTITTPEAEFWYACKQFQKNWAAQFSARVNLTFMPEMWPGMLLKMDTFGFQAYVEQVTHSFDYTSTGMGGGFKTDVNVIAPSSTKGGGLYGLPRAGGGKGGGKGDNRGTGGRTR